MSQASLLSRFCQPAFDIGSQGATTLVRCYGVSGLQSALHLGIACRLLYIGRLANPRHITYALD